MEEIWKIIPGTYEKYSVSNLGRVRRNEHYTDVRPDNYHFNWRKHRVVFFYFIHHKFICRSLQVQSYGDCLHLA